MLLHASCVAIGKKGVLITGAPGHGKSDLALRLIDEGAKLVADDQTLLTIEKNKLVATAPKAIAGFMEVRHVGLLRPPSINKAAVALYVELVGLDQEIERLPDLQTINLLGHKVRRVALPGLAASTPAKIRAILS